MDKAAFWKLIESAKTKSKGDKDGFVGALASTLHKLDITELSAFQEHLDQRMNEACTWPLWAAAYLMNDGCSDDGFEYFRALLIANGKEAFEKAVKDPDSLAKTKLKFGQEGEWEFETLLYVPSQAFEKLAGGKSIPRQVRRLTNPTGNKWSEGDDLSALLPKLASKCAEAEREDDCPLVPGTVFRIPTRSPDTFAYFKVLARDKNIDGIRTMVALLDYPPPNATVPKDCRKLTLRKVRDADPFHPNQWWDVAIVTGWREPDSPRKTIEVLATDDLKEQELAIVKGFTPEKRSGSSTLWESLVDDAAASFDPRVWPEADLSQAPERLRALSPKEILGTKSLLDEFSGSNLRHDTLLSAGTQFIFKHRDFERAAATLELGTRLTPQRHGLWLLLGAMHYALGNRENAEAAWRECLTHAPKRFHSYLTRKIDRTRKAVDTEGRDCKLLSAAWIWASNE